MFRMTDTINSQNTDLSSWDTLYGEKWDEDCTELLHCILQTRNEYLYAFWAKKKVYEEMKDSQQ